MRIGPFIFGKKNIKDVRCFEIEDFSEKNAQDPHLAVNLKSAIRDAGISYLGMSTPENLCCIEDSEGNVPIQEVFEKFGLKYIKEVSPEKGRKFIRFSVEYRPRK